jgi:hypothetical protein
MTRKSRREIQRAVDDLDDNPDTNVPEAIVWEHPETGAWYANAEMDGDPLDPETVDPAMIIQETVVETSWERGSGR